MRFYSFSKNSIIRVVVAFSIGITNIHAQSLQWKLIPSSADPAIHHPLHLFILKDSIIYLGTHHYLCIVDSNEVFPIYYNPDEKSIVRSIVEHHDTVFFSVQNKGVYYIDKSDYTDVHSTPFSRNESGYGSMCSYNHQLVVTGWPRKIAFYDSLQYSWEYSFDLIQNAQGTIFQIEQQGKDLYATLYEGGVFMWEKKQWIALNKGLPEDLKVRGILGVSDKQFVATDQGVYQRPLKSTTWKKIETTFPQEAITEIISYDKWIIALGVRGVIYLSKDKGNTWSRKTIEHSDGYILHSIAILHNTVFITGESTTSTPSGVFKISLQNLLME
ncbi:MAG: hypothetical protein MUE33_04480 [Cytophagaceae bacterium]|jgi:hypothetical protein|nr:hypothetical protein [Cytophagaceae bacterium]